ncbi:Chorismate synthase [Moritella sp. JT01]|nr:Chorismate synthase [Moritella sp. JT01]
MRKSRGVVEQLGSEHRDEMTPEAGFLSNHAVAYWAVSQVFKTSLPTERSSSFYS